MTPASVRRIGRRPAVGGRTGPPPARTSAACRTPVDRRMAWRVLSVAPDSPAQQAGLQPADVLVKFGEDEIRRFDDLSQALQKHKPGDVVAVVVRRGTDEVSLTVTLGEPR